MMGNTGISISSTPAHSKYTRCENPSTFPLASQLMSLGDHLIGVSLTPSLEGINVTQEFLQHDGKYRDLYFFYTSS